jgi:parallel beta-helix repeat protein
MADFVVTTLTDELDSSSPTATQDDFGGANDLSLREALALANANPDLNTITFAASLSGGTLFLTQGELTITSSLTIDADRGNDGIADITISADSAPGADDATTRVFHIGQYGADGVVATLVGLVIRDGIASFGGGIYLDGAHDLWLAHSHVLDNTASRGGGIFGYRGASITLEDSAVSGNVASGGGGIAGGDATWIRLYASTVSDNRARNGAGGGIAVGSDATITLTDSTLSGNRAISDGGAAGRRTSCWTVRRSPAITRPATAAGSLFATQPRSARSIRRLQTIRPAATAAPSTAIPTTR